jgi:hypothetical protein
LATTNKNFKVKNGLDVNGPIGVGSAPSYGSPGQVLTSQGTGSVPTWTTVSSSGLTATDYVVTGKLSSDQTIASNTNDVLISFVDDFDPQGWWNATSKQFTPNVAGYYNVALHVWWTAAGATTNQYNVQIRKNSSTSAIFQNQTVTGSGSSQGGSRLIYLNGTTDYIDFTAYNGDASTQSLQWGGAGQGTWFSAALITAGKGDPGDPGADGSDGADGADAIWNFTGAYNGGVAYAVGDLATYEGQTWYRVNSNGGNVGDTPVEGTFWTLIAAEGAEGAEGPAGASGNSFETISANGTSVVADSSTDTLTITPGDGLSIAGNATSDTITITPNVAGASANGIVTTGAQTFAGSKTFTSNIVVSSTYVGNLAMGGNSISASLGGSPTTLNLQLSGGDVYVGGGNVTANNFIGNLAIGNVTGLGTNVSTFLTTPNSLNFLNTITNETGTGNVVFSTDPVLTTPNIGAAIGTSLNVTANVNASTLRLTSTTDVTNVSTTHAFQIGADSGNNIRIDDNEISRYNNGVVAQLTLNLDGGDVAVGASTSTVIIAGSTQLGLEETQKVVDAGSFYTFANNTYVLDTALGNYFKNITTQRVYNSSTGWVIVGNNTSTALTGTSLTHTLVSSGTAAQGDVAIVVATIDSATNATPTTSSSGWTTNAAAATTYGSAVFYKTMGASPDTTIVVNYGATDIVAVASTVIRSSNILPVYVSAVATPTRANATSGVPTPAATTTTIANTLVVVAGSLRNDVVSGVQSLGPSGYSNYILANVGSVAGTAAASMLATKFVATIGTETPTAFSPRFANGVAVSDYSSAWTFQVAAYADPTITLTNSSFSATYPASTYVLHINNPSAAAAATITWTDATYSYSWQGGTAPTLSSIQPNNIVILETIDGTYLKGALLDSYA